MTSDPVNTVPANQHARAMLVGGRAGKQAGVYPGSGEARAVQVREG